MQLIVKLQPILLIFFSLCAASHSAELRIRLSSQPKNLNWNSATTGSESAIILNVMEGLFEVTRDQTIAPRLAQDFRWSQEGKILEITLKKGVKWADGTPLSAKQFVDSFQNLLSPETNSPHASLLFDLVSAKDYFLGKTNSFSDVGIKADGPFKLVFRFQDSRANFLAVLTHWATFPIRKEKPEITLGPYRITSTSPVIRLEANPLYYGKSPEIKKAEMIVQPDGGVALDSYRKKELDFLLQVEQENLDGVNFAEPIRVVALLHLNPLRAKTHSPEIRRAIMKAIPVNELISQNPRTRLPAKNLLPSLAQDLRLSNSKTNLNSLSDTILTLGYPNDELSRSVAMSLQSATSEVKIKPEPLSLSPGAAKRYDLVLSFFGLDYSEPDQFFSAFTAQGGLDFFDVNSSELSQILHQARLSPLNSKRTELYHDAADYLQNKLSIVMPLFYRRRAYLLSSRFTHEPGFRGSPQIIKIHSKKP